MSTRLRKLIGQNSIPDLPPVYRQIEDAVENPESSFEDIARIVEAHPDLAFRLLHFANSAFYNYPVSVSTVPDALSVIGLQQFKNIALAVSLPTLFERRDTAPLSSIPFWRHSIAVGLCARIMALELRENNTERFLLAGLFHKIGRLLALATDPKVYGLVLDRAEKEDAFVQTIEHELLGFDTNELGALALERWRLPASVIELVRHHSKPVLARSSVQDVSLIHLANFVVESLRMGNAGDRFVPDFSEAAWDYSQLEESRLTYIVEELTRQHEEVCRVFLDPIAVPPSP